jgi:hypothetical protein
MRTITILFILTFVALTVIGIFKVYEYTEDQKKGYELLISEIKKENKGLLLKEKVKITRVSRIKRLKEAKLKAIELIPTIEIHLRKAILTNRCEVKQEELRMV